MPDTELWIDAELGIVVRTRTWGIQMDENNEPVATVGSNMELVSIELGQPDPAEFKAPVGVTVLTVQEVLCRDDPASCETGPPETPLPVTTPEPGPFVLFPPDPAQLVTDTLANYAGLPAMRIEIEGRGGALSWHRYTDGERSSRDELHFSAVEPPTVYLGNDEGWFESWPTDEEPNAWVRHGTAPGPSIASFTLGLPETCPDGWRYLGLDVLLGSAAWHIDCGGEQYWIDRDRLLVVRQVAKPDPLAFDVPTQTVHLVEIVPQPPELFELPADAVVEER